MQRQAVQQCRLLGTACCGLLPVRRDKAVHRHAAHLPIGHLQQPKQGKRCAMRLTAVQRAEAAAVAAPAAAASLLVQPELVFNIATYCIVPLYMLMMLAPRNKLTRLVVNSPLLPVALAVAYAVMLWQFWREGLAQQLVAVIKACHPFPNVHAVASLFAQPTMTAMAWLHLLLLDFIQARSVLMDGLVNQVPTPHSVLLCFMFGPLGLLSHIITKAVVAATRRHKH